MGIKQLNTPLRICLLAVISIAVSLVIHLPFPASGSGVAGLFIFQVLIAAVILLIFSNAILNWIMRTSSGHNGWVVLLITVLYLLYWLPLGFDVTDDGRRLQNSWFMFSGMLPQYVDFRFGSHFFNGLWLHLAATPSLLWVRIGYLLVKALTIGLIWLILRRHLNGWFLFPAIVAAFLVGSIFEGQTINYNNLPVMFVVMAIFFLDRSSESPGSNKEKTGLVLGGAMLVISVFTRFMFVPFLILPLIYFALDYFLDGRDRRQLGIRLKWTYLGIIGCLILVAAGLYLADCLSDYTRRIYTVLIDKFLLENDDSLKLHQHDKTFILNRYQEEFGKVAYMSFQYLAVILAAALLLIRSGKLLRWLIYPAFGALMFYLLWKHQYRYYGLISVNFSLLILYLLFGQERKRYLFVLFWSIALVVFSFVGSGNGVINMITSGGIVISLASGLYLTHELLVTIRRHSFQFNIIAILLVLPLCFLSVSFKTKAIYRDMEEQYLDTPFKSSGLSGIYSNKRRVEVVDSLLNFTSVHITSESKVLCVNTIPMMTYLTAPSSYVDWKVRDPGKKLRLLTGSDAPDFIIMSHKNVRRWKWPDTEEKYDEKEADYYWFYASFLSRSRAYSEVYRNSCFSVHRKITGKLTAD